MVSKFDEAYSRLNTDQKQAVDTIEGPVLVIAGPGTGKTQVLGLRIANILKNTDTNPASILCLTFQDASVIAMKKRLESFIGYAAYKVQIHTFHSFCSEIIRSFPHEFDFSDEVQAIKEVDKLAIIKEILVQEKLTSLQMRNDVLGNFRGIVSNISNLKKEFINPDHFGSIINAYETSFDVKERKLQEKKIERLRDLQIFYKKYLELMKERNLIDFDDMIFKVTEAFSTNDELVKYFQEQYLYTLVDEFQDTNTSQLKVIQSVASFEGLDANVFAVGDDDQTIFRFQGANSDNFEKFLNIFPQSEVIVLHTNYRSNQTIIDAASQVIRQNPGRVSNLPYFESLGLNKNFTSSSGLKENSVQIHEFEHSLHEDYWIGKKIRSLIDGNVKPENIALIARTNRQIVSITKFLDKFKISYQIKRSESILDNKYMQNLLGIFRLIADPSLLKDDTVMWRILSQDFLHLNSFDVFALYHDAKEQKTNMFDFVQKTHLPKYEPIITFINKIIALQQYNANNNFLNLFSKAVQFLDLIKFLETLPESYAELNRLSSLYQFATTRSKVNKNYGLQDFLDETRLMMEKNIVIQSDPVDIDSANKVNIITAHSSKGLEYEYVFMYQCSENKWENNSGGRDFLSLPPLSIEEIAHSSDLSKVRKSLEKLESEVDERRLFYVAMTRAKKELYLSYSSRYYNSDSGEIDVNEKLMSKFVSESAVSVFEKHDELKGEHEEIMKILLTPDEAVEIPDRNKEYLSRIVSKDLHLSATKLNKYQNCAYKFLLEDIFSLPIGKNLNLEIGTAIHFGVEQLTKSFTGTNYLGFDEVLAKARIEFDRNLDKDLIDTSELGSIDVAYVEIERGLKGYYEFFEEKPSKALTTEYITSGVFENIKLRGRIDKIYEEGSEKDFLVITDYKTTSHIPSITEFLGLTKNADKNHLRQLLFYRLLLENSNDLVARKYASKIQALRLEYIDTKSGEVKVTEIPVKGIFEYKKRSNAKTTEDFDIDAEYEVFKSDLRNAFLSIQELKFDRTEDRTLCQFCPFKLHCGR